MQILKIKKLKTNCQIITEEEILKLDINTVLEFNLYEDKVLNPSLIKQIKEFEKLNAGVKTAMRLLNSKFYSTYGLKTKLKIKYKMNNDLIDKVIFELEKNHLLNDKLYQESLIEDLEMKNCSYYEIKSRLKKEKLNIDNFYYNSENELQKALKVVDKLNKLYYELSFNKRINRIYKYYLLHRYNNDIINKVISKLNKNADQEMKNLYKDYVRFTSKNNFTSLNAQSYLLKLGYEIDDIKQVLQGENYGNEIY